MKRQTEINRADVKGIDTWDDPAVLDALILGQERAIAAVRKALPQLSKAATGIAEKLRQGGKLYYAGAGTSIRIAVQDGSELPATFGMDENLLGYLIAGGRSAMFESAALAEDDANQGASDASVITQLDALIAVAASGSTPFTIAAAKTARAAGAFVVCVVNNADSDLGRAGNVEVFLDSGPEVVAGSTRMGAGTAQKAALNLISTLTHIKLGAVYDGLMVNVQPGNEKLKVRSIGIIGQIANVDEKTAMAAFERAHGVIKIAVLLCKGVSDVKTAEELLKHCHGNLRHALQGL